MSQGYGIREGLIVISHLDDFTTPRHHGCGIEMILRRLVRVRGCAYLISHMHCTLYSSTALYGCTVTLYVYPAVPRLPQSQTSHNNTHFAVPEYLCAAKRGAEVLSVRRHLASVAFDSTCRDLPTSAKVLRQELRARPAAGGVSATH